METTFIITVQYFSIIYSDLWNWLVFSQQVSGQLVVFPLITLLCTNVGQGVNEVCHRRGTTIHWLSEVQNRYQKPHTGGIAAVLEKACGIF